MAKTELVSLALIYNGPIHAYLINNTVKGMDMERWAKISPASIYNTLNRLHKNGFVEVSAEKVGNMPERKMYTITDSGREKLMTELEEALLSVDIGEHPFAVAMNFAFGMPEERLIALIDKRIALLQAEIEVFNQKECQLKEMGLEHVLFCVEGALRILEVQIDVARKFKTLIQERPGLFTELVKRKLDCFNDGHESGHHESHHHPTHEGEKR